VEKERKGKNKGGLGEKRAREGGKRRQESERGEKKRRGRDRGGDWVGESMGGLSGTSKREREPNGWGERGLGVWGEGGKVIGSGRGNQETNRKKRGGGWGGNGCKKHRLEKGVKGCSSVGRSKGWG